MVFNFQVLYLTPDKTNSSLDGVVRILERVFDDARDDALLVEEVEEFIYRSVLERLGDENMYFKFNMDNLSNEEYVSF